MKERNDVALRTWAVHCDALARGEQLLLLQPAPADDEESPHGEFWLCPAWEDQAVRDLTDPYRDRLRALEELRHGDGRLRVKFYATVEYRERVRSTERLLAVDGEHTLNARAVEERVADGPGVWLLVLRVYRRADALLLPEAAADGEAGWLRLPRTLETRGLDPVLPEERFFSEKARLLQRTGSVRAL